MEKAVYSDDRLDAAQKDSEGEEDQCARDLHWLLEQDLAEPSDSLFRLVGAGFESLDLSDDESAFADRPMFGGDASADDLSGFIDEEIVLSGDDQGGSVHHEERSERSGYARVMAVDNRRYNPGGEENHIADGTDILSLKDDDDIGSKPIMLVRRSRRDEIASPASIIADFPEEAPKVTEPEPVPQLVDEIEVTEAESVTASEPEIFLESESETRETTAQRMERQFGQLILESDDEDTELPPIEFEFHNGSSPVLEHEDVSSEPDSDTTDIVEQNIQSPITVPEWELEPLAGSVEEDELALDAIEFEGRLTGLPVDTTKDNSEEDLLSAVDTSSNAGSSPDVEEISDIVLPSDPEPVSDGGEGVATTEIDESDDSWLGKDVDEELEIMLPAESTEYALPDLGDVNRFLEEVLPEEHEREQEEEFLADLDDLNTDLEVGVSDSVIGVDTPDIQITELSSGDDFEVSAKVTKEVSIAPPSSVHGYITTIAPPTDDGEFDRYLQAGQHLRAGDEDIDALVVEQTEGVVSVDPSMDADLDYHEDFNLPKDFSSQAVAAISAVMAPAMEQLSEQIEVRLAELDIAAGSVAIDAMLAVDPATSRQCEENGYSPLTEVVPQLPPVLSGLNEQELEAFCVRLAIREDGRSVMGLLQPGFEWPDSVDQYKEDSVSYSVSDKANPNFDFDAAGKEVDFSVRLDSANDATPSEIVSASGTVVDTDQKLSHDYEPTAETVIASETPLGDGLNIFSTEDLDNWDIGSDTDSDSDMLLKSLSTSDADIDDIFGIAVDEFGRESFGVDVSPSIDEDDGELNNLPPHLAEKAGVGATTLSRPGSATDMSWCLPSHIRFSQAPAGGEVFRDFLGAFLEEGEGELEKLEDGIGHWEQDVDSEYGKDVVPRVLHTLKGIAKGIGLQRYGTLIHNFETLLHGMGKPSAQDSDNYFRIVNVWLDATVQGFNHIRETSNDIDNALPWSAAVVTDDSEEQEATDLPEKKPAASGQHKIAAPVREKQLTDEAVKVLAGQQSIRMTAEALDNLLNLQNQAQQFGVRASQSNYRSKRAGSELLARLSSVRSHITKITDRALQSVTSRGQGTSELDALEMDQYSELQEAASILREAIEDLDDLINVSSRQAAAAESLLKQQGSVLTSLGSAIRDARVMSIARLMPGLRRIVRTVGADLGKPVNFHVLNEVGRLDRDSHVSCQTILEHMVRNAIDHGIESPAERSAAGKPENGQITIDVSREGSDYLIRLSDDGRGMDPVKLRETALDRGLDIDVAALSDKEALGLIFHKGFTTAARLSQISGRGVGMDIVIAELQKIGGEIDIDSVLGRGTTFTVRVPSNVNVNGALLVSAGVASYAVPLDGLIAVENVAVEEFFKAVSSGNKLQLHGMDCEPTYLATLCGGGDDKMPDAESWEHTVPVMIAGSKERCMAIAVDSVTEALELVIRSLGTQFSLVPGFAGGATTSDGEAIVALNLNALVRSLATGVLSQVDLDNQKHDDLLVLVVDDSRTQRMVATSQFDSLGVETITAENGLVAIELLNTLSRLPDVVLLDIEMPVKDGIQTLREIRAGERYKNLPVIMVTSRTGPKHRAMAQEAGCNGYMGKPFNFPVLVEQICQLTGHQLQVN
ncbi:MAG: response regulator [Parahaliea sp.]